MKILIFSLAYHPFIGGAEVAIKSITDRLPNVEWEMITVNLDGKQKSSEKLGNVLIHRVGNSKLDKYRFPWLAYKKAKELQKKGGYNIIWAMMANQAGWAALKFKKKFSQIKYLLTLQEGDSELDIWWRTWFMRPLYKNIYRKADKIQAISKFLAKRAERMGYGGKIEVVPNGVKSEWLGRLDYTELIKSRNPRQIITTSRLEKKNGIESLIRSMVDVDGQLIILGDGSLRNRFQGLIGDLGLNNKVNIVGQVSNSEVYQHLAESAVFVRPSLSEGLGNSFLEAMAMYVPIVGTAVGGIVDFLEDNKTGMVCQPKNPRDIAEKINYSLDEKNKEEVEQIVKQARELVVRKYNWDDIAKKMENIFKGL